MADTAAREALEAEREFLLRSLDDLDAERAAGELDDVTYATLRDDYTARAAAVIRRMDEPLPDERPEDRSANPRAARAMRVLTAVGIGAFVVAGAFLLVDAVGSREAGQTATGNDQVATDRLTTLRDAVEQRPDDYVARIAYARALLGQDIAAAVEQFGAAYRLDPTQPEPPAYIGWISGLTAQQLPDGSDRDSLVADALEWFDRSLALDGEYEDAYVFRGLVRYNVVGDARAAVPDLQAFLALAPSDHPMRELVLGALEDAVRASDATPDPDGGT